MLGTTSVYNLQVKHEAVMIADKILQHSMDMTAWLLPCCIVRCNTHAGVWKGFQVNWQSDWCEYIILSGVGKAICLVQICLVT